MLKVMFRVIFNTFYFVYVICGVTFVAQTNTKRNNDSRSNTQRGEPGLCNPGHYGPL